MSLHAVVLAGGSGTRLWPYSRAGRPKQLLPLLDGESLLQATVRRVSPIVPAERLLVLGHRSYVEAIRAQLPQVPPSRVIGEPEPMGTATAIGLATGVIGAIEPDATLIVLPADHLISPDEAFLADVARAEAAAADGWLVTFGIVPDRPESGYGYIELGPQLPGKHRARSVRAFVEKPDEATVARLLATGQCAWNSGMFVWRVPVIAEALRRHLPSVGRLTDALLARPEPDPGWLESHLDSLYAAVTEPTTIDYGVMQPSPNVACVPASFRWSDIGSWSAVADALGSDAGANTTRGRNLTLETTGSLVFSSAGRLVAVLGLVDMVVVDTPDALLVCPKERAQEVKAIVAALARSGQDDLL